MNLNLTKKNQAGIGHIAEVVLMCTVGLLIGTYVAGQFDGVAGNLVIDLNTAESNIFRSSDGLIT